MMGGQEGSERVAQKQRTRQALLQAARELLAEGRQPTVPEAADRAGISRATAYRYFSRPEEMAQEAVLDAVAVEFERIDLDIARFSEPVRRAEHVVAAVLKMVLAREELFRTFLSLSAAGERAGQRGGRRIRWLREALAPVQGDLPPKAFERLLHGLALTCGIETIVVLKDVCSLDDPQAENTARWVAGLLVEGALREASGR
ncbi:MAG TPA: TetR/AcrR family transcriptional regulator [Geminicoccus sp.]|jgi:AcrR family transcriptional regulator|uniref:TetR/AcrR family transcriptional regulator n=1 Tax=Geminicoccus sp. TaxID=2024832 RepID=UPI002E33FE98|nr:TetR/AcrR family transcriptional regulator [Geminicoccus sp.]HEX2526004.1 TetR/AcrR family transcriptional regulator [Geminicoccus sp.]